MRVSICVKCAEAIEHDAVLLCSRPDPHAACTGGKLVIINLQATQHDKAS